MDRKVIFAVAGAGKTSEIINDLNRTQRALIVTYTKENRNNILQRINAKFHCLPDNIVCLTYFSFIYEWGVKPFELRALQKVIDGIDFEGAAPRGLKKSDLNYYTIGTRILHYRLYNFIKWQGLTEKLINRLKYFFDCIYIDEVQDFAGGDFDFIMDLARSSFPCLKIVGDFYQHTYDTSRDGSKNKNLHKNFSEYRGRFSGFEQEDHNKSYRCPAQICDFIRNNLGITMFSLNKNNAVIKLIEDIDGIKSIMSDNNIVKLILKESNKQEFYCKNWGQCKGLEYANVCVLLNQKTYDLYKKGNLSQLKQVTLHKFYVACTRTKGNLFFIKEDLAKERNHLLI